MTRRWAASRWPRLGLAGAGALDKAEAGLDVLPAPAAGQVQAARVRYVVRAVASGSWRMNSRIAQAKAAGWSRMMSV
jgi:hypothetical protein